MLRSLLLLSHGDSCFQNPFSPFVPSSFTSTETDLVHLFLNGEMFPQSFAQIAPCHRPPTASLERPSAQSSTSTLTPLLFARLVSAAIHCQTSLAQVDRTRCSSFDRIRRTLLASLRFLRLLSHECNAQRGSLTALHHLFFVSLKNPRGSDT